MRKSVGRIAAGLLLGASALAAVFFVRQHRVEALLAAYRPDANATPGITVIDAPKNGTVFPPDLAPPSFAWHTDRPAAAWLIRFRFAADGSRLMFRSQKPEWEPAPAQWDTIKARCAGKGATVTVFGTDSRSSAIVCATSASFGISADPVDAPIFYRDVNLPFSLAVQDPSKIRWRFGRVSSREQPPVVLEKLPVCGNCHSFSKDGKTMGMDVDYANDKGSYVISEVAPDIRLTKEKIITWSNYKPEDSVQTFGLLSQVSPDGRYVVSTVKDRSVFLPMPGLEFSQLFFPIQGILAVYDRQTRTFQALPGADDPAFVQSNPAWSPDGRWIVFARSPAYKLRNLDRPDATLLTRSECREFVSEGKTFLYDLYRVPFNGGQGGTPEPLKGASQNGKSNFFPKFSPDGRWIVFCQAASYMLLQSDSALFIVPAEGGEARRLACNLPRMNSWHSWSPNGRWIVFSSKTGSPFTRLFLTHINADGDSTPAVPLAHFTAPNRAANIPEFANVPPGGLTRIREQFVDDVSLLRAGNAFREGGNFEQAAEQYRQVLAHDPNNAHALANLAAALSDMNRLPEATDCLEKALAKEPASAFNYYNLSIIYAKQGNIDEAIRCCSESVRLNPTLSSAQGNLGIFLFQQGRIDEALTHLNRAIRLEPDKDNVLFVRGRILVRKGLLADALRDYSEAVRLSPNEETYLNALAWLLSTAPTPALRNGTRAVELATRLCELTHHESPRALDILGASYAEAGRFPDAVRAAGQAIACAQRQGNQRLAAEIGTRLELYRHGQPFHQ